MRSIVFIMMLMSGCTSMMAAKQHSTVLPTPADRTYTCAVQTMLAMGGVDLHSDAQGGIVSCTMHKAIALTARVTHDGTQSRLDVTGTPIPGLVAIGSFNEIDQFVAKVQECK
jgi:hypothetical protein